MLALTAAGWGQQTSGQGSGHGTTSPPAPPSLSPAGPGDTGVSPQMEQDQAKMRNADRQKQLVSDTQRLLALAQELKVDVDKSNKDTLSLDVIRKADEIEKLAHSVKEKMKGN
jgi:nitric oxide reductase activation protein